LKPIIRIDSTRTPDGGEMVLTQHNDDFIISVDRQELMISRQHESELELARLGCARIKDRRRPTVLIGGLGMGYTLRQALDVLPPDATVVVAELIPEVVKWNREILGELTDHPLRDQRTTVKLCDVAALIRTSPQAFDAILLDIDNGPDALTDARNDMLYSRAGIRSCVNALHANGCLAIWAAGVHKSFERCLRQERLYSHFFRVPAYTGGKALSRCVWVASRDPDSLPALPERVQQLKEASRAKGGRSKSRSPAVTAPPRRGWGNGLAEPDPDARP